MPGAKERVAPKPSMPVKQPTRDGSLGLSRDAVACPSFLRDMPPVDDGPQVAVRTRLMLGRYASGASGSDGGDARNSNLNIPFVQRKLSVGAVNDPLEREADAAADAVVSAGTVRPGSIASPLSGRALQRKCACGGSATGECEECRKKREPPPSATPMIRRIAISTGGRGIAEAPPIVHQALRSPGKALDPPLRSSMENRFGHDFGWVRVHTDPLAAQSAQAVNALAYTAGQDVVFAPGQFSPETQRGQRLLAHELTHVVQQGGQGELSVQRTASPDDEKKKAEAVQSHLEQQRNVAKLLEEGRKLTVDASRGLLDPDNLYRNSIEMLDKKHVLMSVLTPTHDADTRRPPERAYFNSRVYYPHEGGDYPADPAVTSADGLVFNTLGAEATMFTVIPKAPGYLELFADDSLLSADEFRQDFVHEVQHLSDLHPTHFGQPTGLDWEQRFEDYKTEFRSYWIQPGPTPPPAPPPNAFGLIIPPARAFRLGGRLMDEFSSANDKVSSQDDVKVADPGACNVCPTPAAKTKEGTPPAPSVGASIKTAFKNRKQQEIFQHLIKYYTHRQFDCYYVCSIPFRDAVNAYAGVEGLNLVNSVRLYDLYWAVLDAKPSMNRDDIPIRDGVVGALVKLDALDWAFLKDTKESAPLWAAIDSHTPPFIRDGVKKVVKAGSTPNSFDILGLLDEKPSLLKDRKKRP